MVLVQDEAEEVVAELVEPDVELVELGDEAGEPHEEPCDLGFSSVKRLEEVVFELSSEQLSSGSHACPPSSSSPKRGSPSPGRSLHPRRRVTSTTRSRSRSLNCPQDPTRALMRMPVALSPQTEMRDR